MLSLGDPRLPPPRGWDPSVRGDPSRLTARLTERL